MDARLEWGWFFRILIGIFWVGWLYFWIWIWVYLHYPKTPYNFLKFLI
ncbi:hypothetical protein [uncultured Gammaproteobacteria bacterium]|nr:hypothetical protein [uncultured Gammaproteobacteria bacterium]